MLAKSRIDSAVDVGIVIDTIHKVFDNNVDCLGYSILQGEEYMPIKYDDILLHANHVNKFSARYPPQVANDETDDLDSQDEEELFKNAVYVDVKLCST
ncbi:hypothetical protein GGH13_007237, partial [Coemansia sp. S155-1]